MADYPDIAVDRMDLSSDGRLRVGSADVRDRGEPAVGRHAIVGEDDADPSIDADGHIPLEVLPGPLEAQRDLLSRT